MIFLVYLILFILVSNHIINFSNDSTEPQKEFGDGSLLPRSSACQRRNEGEAKAKTRSFLSRGIRTHLWTQTRRKEKGNEILYLSVK